MTPNARFRAIAFALLAGCAQAAVAQSNPSAAASGDDTAAPFVGQQALRPDPVILDNGNIYTVYNLPTSVPSFRLDQRTRITVITTYHWNDGRGARPGWITLLDSRGRIYGPWVADGSPGQGGVPNAYWTVRPNVTLASGSYSVVDSDIFTWAHNEGTGGDGIVRVEGRRR